MYGDDGCRHKNIINLNTFIIKNVLVHINKSDNAILGTFSIYVNEKVFKLIKTLISRWLFVFLQLKMKNRSGKSKAKCRGAAILPTELQLSPSQVKQRTSLWPRNFCTASRAAHVTSELSWGTQPLIRSTVLSEIHVKDIVSLNFIAIYSMFGLQGVRFIRKKGASL